MIAPRAAKHGAQKRLNNMNEIPASFVKLMKSRTPNTPTTSSFATRPMIVAIVALALPNPSGANIHLIPFPICPNILSASSISGWKPNPLSHPNTEPAQITIDERRIIVPAFLIMMILFPTCFLIHYLQLEDDMQEVPLRMVPGLRRKSSFS